ncbi:hypothetical protein K4F52_010384, partial [Lecanicillium sp. MT-2017a]
QPTEVDDRRDNNKPPLWQDLKAGMQDFDAASVLLAKKRLKHAPPTGADEEARCPLDSAAILLQQEIIEYVLDNLHDFRRRDRRAWLSLFPDGREGSSYGDRFRSEPWAGLLRLVGWYAKDGFRPEWQDLRAKGYTGAEGQDRRHDAGDDDYTGSPIPPRAVRVSRAICRDAAAGIGLGGAQYNALRLKFGSDDFQAAFGAWLWQHCRDELKKAEAEDAPHETRKGSPPRLDYGSDDATSSVGTSFADGRVIEIDDDSESSSESDLLHVVSDPEWSDNHHQQSGSPAAIITEAAQPPKSAGNRQNSTTPEEAPSIIGTERVRGIPAVREALPNNYSDSSDSDIDIEEHQPVDQDSA